MKGSAREKQNFRMISGNFASLKYYPYMKDRGTVQLQLFFFFKVACILFIILIPMGTSTQTKKQKIPTFRIHKHEKLCLKGLQSR
jgi:hypothetical protein